MACAKCGATEAVARVEGDLLCLACLRSTVSEETFLYAKDVLEHGLTPVITRGSQITVEGDGSTQ